MDLPALVFRAPVGAHFLRVTRAIERPGWYQVVTPSSRTAAGNEVVCSAVPVEQIEAMIDAVEATYAEIGAQFKWCVGPTTRPLDMSDRLDRRGYASWGARGMACPTDLAIAAPPEVTVERVGPESLAAYLSTCADGWDTPPDAREALALDARWAVARGRFAFYLARIDGAPAGTAGVVQKPAAGDAPAHGYLTGGNVLPAFRGRGVYRALLAARLAALRAAGASLAVTQAREATSAPILERLGFGSVYDSRIHLSPPLSPEPV